MEKLKADFFKMLEEELSKSLKLDIFSILFILDIICHFSSQNHRNIFAMNDFINNILKFFEVIFNKSDSIIIIMILCIIIISVSIKITAKIDLPKKVITSGEYIRYDGFTALKNMLNLLYYYVYSLNIVFISIIIWFNTHIDLNKQFTLVKAFVVVDILILIFKVFSSFFKNISKFEFKDIIDDENFENYYYVISSKKIDIYTSVMIIKDINMDNHAFYVVKKEKRFTGKNILRYTILNRSLNFEDIKYSYEFYAKNLKPKYK